jgi:hypothetical protein
VSRPCLRCSVQLVARRRHDRTCALRVPLQRIVNVEQRSSAAPRGTFRPFVLRRHSFGDAWCSVSRLSDDSEADKPDAAAQSAAATVVLEVATFGQGQSSAKEWMSAIEAGCPSPDAIMGKSGGENRCWIAVDLSDESSVRHDALSAVPRLANVVAVESVVVIGADRSLRSAWLTQGDSIVGDDMCAQVVI